MNTKAQKLVYPCRNYPTLIDVDLQVRHSLDKRESSNQYFLGSSEKFVGNFLGSLALYSNVHAGMTKVVLSVIFV
uniref:Uncharacterized protein n=1 Tax=Candidatus Kentrum sp. UNK TaxID=2126344 RepID=A0A451AQA8_9GAMM|nr:MAG: hypothetical protein BECKUNK1418G_GA0071005_12106 [Candidatus Kentron sp. UNK]VFK73476.1 MAG: hypothetical protein BECKUNK1418H_GA0071006_12076 [Candidatus Kentron sp. UNK]